MALFCSMFAACLLPRDVVLVGRVWAGRELGSPRARGVCTAYAIVFNEIGSTSTSVLCRRGISLHATVDRRHLSSRHAYTVLLKYAKRPLYRASGGGSRRRDVSRHGMIGKR